MVDTTAAAAREVLIGITALLIFTTIAIIAAGINENWGRGVLALFLAFALLQVIFNASPFQKYLSAHPILTGKAL